MQKRKQIYFSLEATGDCPEDTEEHILSLGVLILDQHKTEYYREGFYLKSNQYDNPDVPEELSENCRKSKWNYKSLDKHIARVLHTHAIDDTSIVFAKNINIFDRFMHQKLPRTAIMISDGSMFDIETGRLLLASKGIKYPSAVPKTRDPIDRVEAVSRDVDHIKQAIK